jgi:polysaccharide biosynthesis protein PslJ
MPVLGILLLAAVGVAVAVGASLEIGFGAVVAFWLLVPGNLVVVGLPHIVLVDRLVLYAFALRLVLRHGQRGEPPRSAFRFTAVHAALAAVLVVGYVDGVVVAQRGLSLASDLDTWLYTLDVVVVFVAGLAVIRTVGPRRVVATIVGVAALSAVVGIIERITGSGWSNFFFEHLSATYRAPGAGALQKRAGHVRSQAASQFALEYGWVLTMLLPLALVTAFRWARGPARLAKAAYLLPVLMAVSVALAASRSAELAVAVGGLLVTVLAGFPRRFITAMAVAAAVVTLIAVADPSLIGASFTSASHTNSISVRIQRLPDVFALVVHRPFTGIGYSGVSSTVPGLDDAYALLYVTLGVIGLAAWVALLVTAGATSLRSLAAPRNTWMRDLGAANVVGIVTVAVAGAAYDVVATPQSRWTFALLAALAVAVREAVPARAPIPYRPRRNWALRLVLPLAGVGVGCILLSAAPMASSETLDAFAVTPAVLASSSQPPDLYTAKVLIGTLCDYLDSPDRVIPGSTLRCEQLSVSEPSAWPAEAMVRIGAPTPAAVRREYRRSVAGLAPDVLPVVAAQGTVQTGKPAWATTAPLWAGAVGLGLMLFVPPIRLRRRGTPVADPQSASP